MSYLDNAIGVKQIAADGLTESLPSRDTLAFTGSGVSAYDNPVDGETVLSFAAPEDVLPVAITAPALGADETALNPAGWDGAGLVRMTASAPVALLGMVAPTVTGTPRKTLALLPDSERIEIKHLDSGAAVGRRIVCPFGLPYFFVSNTSIDVLYDATAGEWRLVP